MPGRDTVDLRDDRRTASTGPPAGTQRSVTEQSAVELDGGLSRAGSANRLAERRRDTELICG